MLLVVLGTGGQEQTGRAELRTRVGRVARMVVMRSSWSEALWADDAAIRAPCCSHHPSCRTNAFGDVIL